MECAIVERGGRPALQIGDVQFFNQTGPEKKLELLRLAGVCRRK